MAEETTSDITAITERLDRIIGLLALSMLKPDQSQQDKAVALNRAGLSPKEIAALLGSTSHTVSQALFAAKRTLRPAGKKQAKRRK